MDKKIETVILILLAFIVFTDNAYAYLDLGSGSYILQIFLAAILSVGFAIKIYWGRIKTFFKVKK